MNKFFVEDKGAALAMTLIVMLVLMIFGTSFLSMSLSDNKFAIKQEDKLQSYYIARAGAQSVAEYLVKGDFASDVIGKTSDYYPMNGGTFKVQVLYPNPLDPKIVDIKSVGKYNKVEQTVKVRVTGTDPGIGMFKNTFYSFANMNGGLNSAVVNGSLEAGGAISVNNVPSTVTTASNVVYDKNSIKIPTTFDETITSLTSSHTFSAPTNIKIGSIDLHNYNPSNNSGDKLTINGTGVVNLFIYGNADIKGDIEIMANAQLHIYVIGNYTLNFQGDPGMYGKMFIYAPDGNVTFSSSIPHGTTLSGLIIANNITLSNHLIFTYDPLVYSAIIEQGIVDVSNVGINFTGYTWLPNN